MNRKREFVLYKIDNKMFVFEKKIINIDRILEM